MESPMVRPAEGEEFGREIGLIKEVLITGRKVGAGKKFWSRLAHDEELFRRVVEVVTPSSAPDAPEELAEQVRFYRDVFEIELDPVSIQVPAYRRGFDRVLVVAEGLTPNRVYAECEKRFTCWRHMGDLDKAVRGRNDREPTKTYAIRLRDRVEADRELKNLSAVVLAGRKVAGVTLLERLLLEPWYFWKTGKHLDLENRTLCSGSRYADSTVPGAGFDSGTDTFGVSWAGREWADSDLRSRAVVL